MSTVGFSDCRAPRLHLHDADLVIRHLFGPRNGRTRTADRVADDSCCAKSSIPAEYSWLKGTGMSWDMSVLRTMG